MIAVRHCQPFPKTKYPLFTNTPTHADLTFYISPDCSGSPLLIFPPALELRERPVAGCSNYAAAGITRMSFRKIQ